MKFDDPLNCYEAIGDALVRSIPGVKWNKIWVEAELDGASVNLIIRYEDILGRKGEIGYVPMLARYFYELGRLVSDVKKGFYRNCNFVLNADGKFNVEFEYK